MLTMRKLALIILALLFVTNTAPAQWGTIKGQVVYDGPSAALTPALLRGLYGVQADEILSDASGAHPAPAHAPMPAPQWSPAMVQAA